jgi:hypothetical protein
MVGLTGRRVAGTSLTGALCLGGLAIVAGCGGGSGPTGGVIPDPGEVTLLDVQTQVFNGSCALTDCHVSAGAPFGLDLSSVGSSSANLINVPSTELAGVLRIEPFNADDSYLYMKVTGDARIGGEQMPAEGEPLNASDLALIRDWINQGAN